MSTDPDDMVGVVIMSVYNFELTSMTGFGGTAILELGLELSVFDVAVDEDDRDDPVRHWFSILGLGWTAVKFLGFT